MKTLMLSLAAILFTPSAQAMPFPTLDKVQALKCTVESATGHSSFLPPEAGDTFIYATFQDRIHELKFDRHGRPEMHPYLPLPVDLERVDHSGHRTPYKRTYVGIRESLAQNFRQEGTLTVQLGVGHYVAEYVERHRTLPNGEFFVGGAVNMDCVITLLDLNRDEE